MRVCKYASMQVCKYASMQVCTYMQVCKYDHIGNGFQKIPYSNLLYPTYITNKSEAIYMSAVAAFFSLSPINRTFGTDTQKL